MGKIKRRTTGAKRFPLQEKAVAGERADFMLAHVTAVGAAREILRSGTILARICTILGKALAYFFVLRPAYKPKNGDQPSDQLNKFPFVFVLDAVNLGTPHHVYPFDTGGALKEQFDLQADEFVPLDDYRLLPNYAAVAGHIKWAFGTRGAYYDGELVNGLIGKLAHHEDVARSFLRIAAMASIGNNAPDDRASAIEIAFSHNIPIKGNVKFAVMPKQFLEDPLGNNDEMLKALKDAGISCKFYEWEPNRTPEEFRDEISRLVKEYLVGQGQL